MDKEMYCQSALNIDRAPSSALITTLQEVSLIYVDTVILETIILHEAQQGYYGQPYELNEWVPTSVR